MKNSKHLTSSSLTILSKEALQNIKGGGKISRKKRYVRTKRG